MVYADLFNKLQLPVPNRCFEPLFYEALAEFQAQGVFFLDSAYIDRVHSLGNCLSNCLEAVKQAAAQLRADPLLSLHALFLYKAMLHRALFKAHLAEFQFPAGTDAARRFLPFLVLLPTIPQLHDSLKHRKVPEDVIEDTLRQYEDCLFLFEERFGAPGLHKRYFDHLQLYVDAMILNIGRLRFERIPQLESSVLILRSTDGQLAVLFDGAETNAKGRLHGTPPERENLQCFPRRVVETDTAYIGFPADPNGNCSSTAETYPKNLWQPIWRKNDAVLGVHIHNKGALTQEACEQSFRKARQILRDCYPTFTYSVFHCHSWMLDPQLRDHLPADSRILDFQNRFTLFAGETDGTDVFNFVFKLKFKEYADMPEDTSLQRSLKQHYLAGKYIYEYEGIIPAEA